MKAVLGIDTSNYTSSCALVGEDLQLLSHHRQLLPVRHGERGLRQSEAVFAHIRQLPGLFAQLVQGSPADIAAVSVAEKPVDLASSYMPVFQAGLSFAQSFSALMGVPCYLTTHQRGHVAAASMGMNDLPTRHLAMHLSGGTTELLNITDDHYQLIGQSLDLHAGQLVDRVGVRMGLSFPAGPGLEGLALAAQPLHRYKISLKGVDCHLSGLEAQAMRDLDEGQVSHQQVAVQVLDALARTAAGMLIAGSAGSSIQHALVFGGIASSGLFRQMLTDHAADQLRLHFGKPELSGDNAVGVALLGARKHFCDKQ